MGLLRQVCRWSRRHLPFGYLFLVVAVELFIYHLILIAFFEAPVYSLLFELLLTPFLPAYWLQIQLSDKLREATQRERRMELAVTLLSAREYLFAHVRKSIVCVSWSFASIFIIAVLCLLPYVQTLAELSMFACFAFVAFIYGIVFTYSSLAGLFDLVYWSCKVYPSGFMLRKLPALAYCLAAPFPALIVALGIPALIWLIIAGSLIIPFYLAMAGLLGQFYFSSAYPFEDFVVTITGLSPELVSHFFMLIGMLCLVFYPIFFIGIWGVLRKLNRTKRKIGQLVRYYALPFAFQIITCILVMISIGPELDSTTERIERLFGTYLWDEDVILWLFLLTTLMCFSPVAFNYSRWLLRRNVERACRAFYRFE